MTVPESPAVAAMECAAATAGPTDADDLAAILDDDRQIDVIRRDLEAHRQAIVDRLGIDAIAPVMLALSRVSALGHQISVATEAMSIEVRLIRNYLGEPTPPRGAA